jgi:exopolysaccharide production protein ExoY
MSINEFSTKSLMDANIQSPDNPTHYPIRHNALKRAFDIIFSIYVLLIASPLFVLMAGLIKLTSKGSIFYSSFRLGRGGKSIKCWKFRTMCMDAEVKLQEILEKDPQLREEWNKYFKLREDPRLTPIGKFLRKTSVDEFPQFWNVLKGDLSVVGPRPFLVKEDKEIRKYAGDKIEKILSVRPGVTGIWQTSGRSLLTFEERIRLDESYIDEQSLIFDLYLICKTIPMLIFPKGAF